MASMRRNLGGYAGWKRVLDMVFSGALLFFLWLPMLCIAILIRLTSPGEAIFRQTRVGRNGRFFTCYKFRTMIREAPPNCPTVALTDAERYVTPIGRILRKTSLDELPQLWNVLKGEMSLVGPRPLIPKEETVHRLRMQNGVYRVRPGMTGLAQINGRDFMSDTEKAAFDTRYAERMTLWEDIRILWRTFGGVFLAKGISN